MTGFVAFSTAYVQYISISVTRLSCLFCVRFGQTQYVFRRRSITHHFLISHYTDLKRSVNGSSTYLVQIVITIPYDSISNSFLTPGTTSCYIFIHSPEGCQYFRSRRSPFRSFHRLPIGSLYIAPSAARESQKSLKYSTARTRFSMTSTVSRTPASSFKNQRNFQTSTLHNSTSISSSHLRLHNRVHVVVVPKFSKWGSREMASGHKCTE